jgi:copper transport protein
MALLHATLLRSIPAANSHLAKSPQTIRLIYSERVVAELSRITLIGPRADTSQLKIGRDPNDSRSLLGEVPGELSGEYKVTWRAVAADGHPSSGSFNFTVGLETATAAVDSSTVAKSGVGATSPTAAISILPLPPARAATLEEKPVPVFASLFRGVGLGAMMAGIGILFFGVTAAERRVLIPGALVTSAIAVGALLLVAHAIMWLEHVSPTGHLTSDFLSSVFKSTVGQVELLRVLFAVLTLWAVASARHRKIALGLGVACLVVSGAAGHPAAIHPFWAIPGKVVHLLSASVWVGGLLWLVWVARCDEAACRIEARRVSSIALVAVIMIFLSGLLQTVLFLNTPSDLFEADYGRLVLAKMIGLFILAGFGAYNRFGLLPKAEIAGMTQKLARSAKQEIAIVSLVILIGGFLAYVPTPPIH